MQFKNSVQTLVVRMISFLGLSLVLGLLFGHAWAFLAFACLAFLFWHYRQLIRLIDWLWQSKAISPPESRGVWGEIYNGLHRKIRRYRNKQKLLNEKIRQFRDGAEALPDAALVLSNDLTIQWGNKKAQNLLGIRWPGDAGLRIDNLIRFPNFIHYLEEENFDSPCLITSPINSEMFLELRFMDYGNDQVLFLARDVSKVQRLEQIRRDFVANVSHELKTPLTVMRGYVEMIQSSENNLAPHWMKAFSTIETQVSRMDRLVEQLLVLSRAEANANADKVESDIVDVPSMLAMIKDESTWLNQQKQHALTFDVSPYFGLKGNDAELKSAFANLVSNAIAYTPDHGEIKVSWQKVGNEVHFAVNDNGDGIRTEDLERLTERFYRVDKSRSRDTGGSGLGLAIVKHIANHHDAELRINSEVGIGSTFCLAFNSSAVVNLKK